MLCPHRTCHAPCLSSYLEKHAKAGRWLRGLVLSPLLLLLGLYLSELVPLSPSLVPQPLGTLPDNE